MQRGKKAVGGLENVLEKKSGGIRFILQHEYKHVEPTVLQQCYDFPEFSQCFHQKKKKKGGLRGLCGCGIC